MKFKVFLVVATMIGCFSISLAQSNRTYSLGFVVHAEMPWGGTEHTAYLGQIPSKWFSADGLRGTILFAGDYTNREPAYYGFMTQPFTLKLKSPQ